MSRFSDTVYTDLGDGLKGAPIPGVSVYVYDWDVPSSTTGALSALTDDDPTTALPNPLTTDEFGQFYFNSTNGVKLIEFQFAGKLLYRQQIILTPAGFYPGNDATLRADLAALGGATLVNTTFPAPAFSNSAFSSSAQYITNGAAPGSMYSGLQGGQNATEGFTAAIVVPVTATNHQTNAHSGYIRSDRAQVGNGGDVAGYFQAIANANNSAVFALNAVMADSAGKTGQKLNNEIDVNVNAADTTVTGLNLVLVANLTLTGTRNAFRADKAFGVQGWSNGFVTVDGAIENDAVFIGSQTATAGTDRDSQTIALTSYNTANTRFIGRIFGDHTGGIALRPGSALGNIAFQDPAGTSNWASVNVNGLNLPTGKALLVNNVPVIGARSTGWAVDTGTAEKTAHATYTAGTTLTYSAAYVQAEQTAMATRMAAVEAALQAVTRGQKAIKDALITHGLFGA